jgi:hypothetical protein
MVSPLLVAPVAAYEGEHYAWTYYLALHVGYTKRQAYQIASAAYAVDWDPDTGPMEAQPLDVVVGAQHNALWDLQGMPSEKVAGIWRRFHAFADVTHCVITQQERDLLVWLNPEEVMQRTWEPLWPWMKSKTPPLLQRALREAFGVLPLCGQADLARVASSRAAAREALWTLAKEQRNPGPLIHFVQDTYAHGDYTAVRGHALVGHVPDYLGADSARALAMTQDTIAVLQQFMREVLNQTPKQPDMRAIQAALKQLEGANVVPDGSSLWFNWTTWDPGSSPALSLTLQRYSVLAGSPSLEASLSVIRNLVSQDERAGRLPPPFPNAPVIPIPQAMTPSTYVDSAVPDAWMAFRFNLGGYVVPSRTINGRRVEPRYAVEQVRLSWAPPAVSHQAITRDRVRATFRFPYVVENAPLLTSQAGMYLSGLPVLETVREADGAGVPRQVLERRSEGDHFVETTIERNVADLERAIVWDVVAHPYGLDPIRQQVPVRVNMSCAAEADVTPDLQRLRAIAGGIDGVAAQRRGVITRTLEQDLPGIERDRTAAITYLRQLESAYDQLQAACRSASQLVGQVAQTRAQLDQSARDVSLLRSTAVNLAGVTCEVAKQATTSNTAEGRQNAANNAAGFARQTEAKAEEARTVAARAKVLHDQIEHVIQQARLRDLVETDNKRQASLTWFEDAIKGLRDRLAKAEAAIAELPDPRAEADRLASGITTRLTACLRTTPVKSTEDEVRRLSARVRDVLGAPDQDTSDIPPLADWTRSRLDELEATVKASRIQRPGCRGATDLMATLEPQPRELAATLDTIDLFVGNARDAVTQANACAATAGQRRTGAAPASGGPIYRVVETRVEPQLIGASPDMTKVYPGLKTDHELRGQVGAVTATGRLTITAPSEIRGNEEFTIAATGRADWLLRAQVFQWINVNLNVLGRGENKTTGQEMNPAGSYSQNVAQSVTTSLAQEGGRWEANGRIYRELRVSFGAAFTEYGILVKIIYATEPGREER